MGEFRLRISSEEEMAKALLEILDLLNFLVCKSSINRPQKQDKDQSGMKLGQTYVVQQAPYRRGLKVDESEVTLLKNTTNYVFLTDFKLLIHYLVCKKLVPVSSFQMEQMTDLHITPTCRYQNLTLSRTACLFDVLFNSELFICKHFHHSVLN